MGRNKKLTNDQVREALINSRGLTTLAADALGVDWKTIMRYINASQSLQDVIQVSRHKRTQFAKSKLDEAIMRGESWAIMFTLKNKIDPDAEFVGERNTTEHTGKDGGPIEVKGYTITANPAQWDDDKKDDNG